MAEPRTRFLLLNDSEQGIDLDWYHLFEPTIELEIRGKQVLSKHSNGGIRNVIIFVFMEYALKLTERMLTDLKSDEKKEFVYYFTGTGHGLKLRFQGETFEIELITDPTLGPVSIKGDLRNPRRLGTVSPVEWVKAVVGLGQELVSRFKSYPDSSTILKHQERRIRILDSWLSSKS